MQTASKLTNRAYCYNPARLILAEGKSIALLGRHQVILSAPVEKKENHYYVMAKDLEKILAPDYSNENPGEMVDVEAVLAADKTAPVPTFTDGKIMVYSLNGSNPELPKKDARQMLSYLEPKHLGDLYCTRWYEEVSRLNSYRLYVPSNWAGLKEKKMIMVLHGAGGNDCDPFDRARGELQRMAEKRGYLIFSPNSYVVRSNFGGCKPPSGMFKAPRFTDRDGNPSYYPQVELDENLVGEKMFMDLLKDLQKQYQVTEGKTFLMGNSMGGIGTFHLGAKYPEEFRVIFPSGAIPEPSAVDWKAYGNKPIHYLAGTEDHNGFEQMVSDFAYIKAQGVNIDFTAIGGGFHSDAWTYELEMIFDTCDAAE